MSTPIKPINGRVLVRQLPYKPSKVIEIVNTDNAFDNEGIVERVPDFVPAMKLIKSRGRVVGKEATGALLPCQVKIGDRVIFKSKYQDDDWQITNGVKYRYIDHDDILSIIEVERPEGFENPITGDKSPDKHPLLIH